MRAIFFFLLCVLTACGDDDVPPIVDAAPACELRAVTVEVSTPERTYRLLPADAELVLGFQGFRYVYLKVRTDGRPSSLETSALVEFASGEPISQSFLLELSEESPGQFVSAPQMFFFNDSPLPGLIDQPANLTLRVGDARCSAETRGTLTLRYDPNCYEGPAGDRICPDGGVPLVDGGP